MLYVTRLYSHKHTWPGYLKGTNSIWKLGDSALKFVSDNTVSRVLSLSHSLLQGFKKSSSPSIYVSSHPAVCSSCFSCQCLGHPDLLFLCYLLWSVCLLFHIVHLYAFSGCRRRMLLISTGAQANSTS